MASLSAASYATFGRTMDRADFIGIATDLQARWWAFPIPGTALDYYEHDLRDLDADAVTVAIAALDATGEFKQPPTAGQIRRKVAEMALDAPDWDTVRTSLVMWRRSHEHRQEAAESWTCPEGICDGTSYVPVPGVERHVRHCLCRPAYVRALRGWDALPDLVAEFLADGHLEWGEIQRCLDLGDTTAESQIRTRWQQFAGRAVESRVLAALPAGDGVPRISAARAESDARSRRDGDLRRVSAVALLERGDA